MSQIPKMIIDIRYDLVLCRLDNEHILIGVLELEGLSIGFDVKDFRSFCQNLGWGVSILRVGSGSLLSRQSVRRTNIQLLSGD